VNPIAIANSTLTLLSRPSATHAWRVAEIVILLFALTSPAALLAQATLRAPRPGLEDVRLPSLENLERAVAGQIESVQQSSAAVIQNPDASDLDLAYANIASLHHSYELFDAARPSYANAARLTPRDFRWPYLLGHLASERGDLAEALRWYELAVSLNESYVPAWVNLAKTYQDLDRLDDASKALQNALTLAPESPAALATIGEVELRQRRYEQAIEHLEAAIEKIPQANRLHYSLAMAYRGVSNIEQARSHIQQSGKVGVRPDDPVLDAIRGMRVGGRVYTLEGKTAFQAGRYDDAARLFNKAVDADPSDASALINLGTALGQLGDLNAAIERFQSALKIDPAEATALFNLGVLSGQTGDHAAAVEYLSAYLDGQPDDVEARRELAKALSRLSRFPAAEEQFRMLLRATPADEDSLMALANDLAQQNRYEEIVALLQSSLEKFPGNVRTMHALARVLAAAPDRAVRDGARALTLAQTAFKLQGSVAHGQTVAQAFAELGRCEKAAELQSKLVAAADRASETAMASELRSQLAKYQSGPPCAAQ
jgi:tetratricopeptide (TPR) repeat protein